MSFDQGRRSNMTCALKVDTSCKGWERTTIKILDKIKGVNYDLNAKKGVIYITGKVEPREILRKVATKKNNIRLSWIRYEDQFFSGNDNGMYYPIPMHPSTYTYMEPTYHTGFYPSPPPQIPYYQYQNYEPYPPQLPYYY